MLEAFVKSLVIFIIICAQCLGVYIEDRMLENKRR